MTNDELYNMVCVGKENARPLDYYMAATGMSERILRNRFKQMRRKLQFVISLQGGYFRPETVEELRQAYRFHHSYTKASQNDDYYFKKGIDTFDMVSMV